MDKIAEQILEQLCNLCMDEGDDCFQLIGGTYCQKVLNTQEAILVLMSEREKAMREALEYTRFNLRLNGLEDTFPQLKKLIDAALKEAQQ